MTDLPAGLQRFQRQPILGYAVAVVAPVIGVVFRELFAGALIGFPFITLFPAVMATALVGTRGAGAVATLLSAALGVWFWIEPKGALFPLTFSDIVGITFFIFSSATVVLLVDWLKRVLASLDRTRARLAAINEALEARVDERTQALARTNAELVEQIAARETAEARARQAQKMEAVGQLTGGVAHDFNNMLAVIIGNLDLARRRLANGSPGQQVAILVEQAIEAAERSASLTHRLLAFSRRQALSPRVLDLNQLVRGMEDLLRRTLGERVTLEVVAAAGLWRCRIDATELEQALLNLAVNARDAMPDGGRLTIETLNTYLDDGYAAQHDEVTPGQYAMVAVTDTGTGMPSQVIERAFDPFFTTKGVGKGTGLGLSQVYGFVKQSGGHVKIYSEPQRGTTVKLYFQRIYEEGDSDLPSSTEQSVPGGRIDELILVVEDDRAVRDTTVEALRELGYGVRHASSGEAALQMLETLPDIRLLLTDVVMPGMTGRQLAEAARDRLGEIKVLYTTGYTPNAIVHNGVLDQGLELLTKPFTIDQLARKVRAIIDR